MDGELTAGWRELWNKAEAYRLVGLRRRQSLTAVGADGGGPAGLAALVAEVYERWPQTAVYRLERLSYDRVFALWRRGQPPSGLLAATGTPLPEAALPLLHAGLGMALARLLLRPPLAARQPAALAARLERFLALVRSSARPEYEAVAVESCGVVVRMFRPWLHAAVARWMAVAGRHLERLYWHGAGRGMYFLPGSLLPLPGSARRALRRCRREPPDALTRQDALAGLAFAVTMVNWRQPRLIERLFHLVGEPAASARSGGGVDEDEAAAFASGVAACIFARRHTMPGEPSSIHPPVLADLALGGSGGSPCAGSSRGSPGSGGSWEPRAELWESQIRRPCAAALEVLYPWLVERRELSRFALCAPLAPLLAVAARRAQP